MVAPDSTLQSSGLHAAAARGPHPPVHHRRGAPRPNSSVRGNRQPKGGVLLFGCGGSGVGAATAFQWSVFPSEDCDDDDEEELASPLSSSFACPSSSSSSTCVPALS